MQSREADDDTRSVVRKGPRGIADRLLMEGTLDRESFERVTASGWKRSGSFRRTKPLQNSGTERAEAATRVSEVGRRNSLLATMGKRSSCIGTNNPHEAWRSAEVFRAA